MWKKLRSDAPDEALRSNIKVFLAGALEATTSYATWAISHLARNENWHQQVYAEVAPMHEYSPEQLDAAPKLNAVLNETLRLTPSLYLLPRKATVETRVETSDGRVMLIPERHACPVWCLACQSQRGSLGAGGHRFCSERICSRAVGTHRRSEMPFQKLIPFRFWAWFPCLSGQAPWTVGSCVGCRLTG